jgi:hypothetical protein
MAMAPKSSNNMVALIAMIVTLLMVSTTATTTTTTTAVSSHHTSVNSILKQSSTAASTNNNEQITLAGGTIHLGHGHTIRPLSQLSTTAARSPRHPLTLNKAAATDNTQQHEHEQWIVKLKHINEPLIARLHQLIAPYTLSTYLGHHSYLLVAPESVASLLSYTHSSIGIIGVVEYHSSLRVHPELQRSSLSPSVNRIMHAHSGNAKVPLTEQFRVVVAPPSGDNDKGEHSYERTQQLADRWSSQLAQSLDVPLADIHIEAVSESRMLVSVRSKWMVSEAINVLSSHHIVHWIEPHRSYTLLNNHARYIIQSEYEGHATIWNESITGEGQIIAHGDTGIDYDTCFWKDAHHEVPLNTINFNHRVC